MSGSDRTFYVGATLAKAGVAQAVAEGIINKFGYRPTYRWFDIGAVNREEYPTTALMEMNGVLTADIFVGLVPGMRLGMSTELGAAIADKQRNRYKRVILWGQTREDFTTAADGLHPSVFVAHPHVERILGEDPVKTVVEYLFGRGDRVLSYP
jgi:hypothetical protein